MRQLSINRRKPHLVDLLVDKTPGAYSYKLKWGANFDTSPFADFLTSPLSGFRDSAVDDASNITIYGDRVRILFDPTTYGIPDNTVWWIKSSPLNSAGAEMSTSAALMILPSHPGGAYFPQLTITGSAPNVATLANSLEINFPQQMRDVRIQSTAAIWAAFDPSGPEILLPGDPLPKDISRWSTQSALFVRGNGAAVPFSLVFTLAYTQ
jgi:hypothetical protein